MPTRHNITLDELLRLMCLLVIYIELLQEVMAISSERWSEGIERSHQLLTDPVGELSRNARILAWKLLIPSSRLLAALCHVIMEHRDSVIHV